MESHAIDRSRVVWTSCEQFPFFWHHLSLLYLFCCFISSTIWLKKSKKKFENSSDLYIYKSKPCSGGSCFNIWYCKKLTQVLNTLASSDSGFISKSQLFSLSFQTFNYKFYASGSNNPIKVGRIFSAIIFLMSLWIAIIFLTSTLILFPIKSFKI